MKNDKVNQKDINKWKKDLRKIPNLELYFIWKLFDEEIQRRIK